MPYESRLSLTVDSRTGEQSLRRLRSELDQAEDSGNMTTAALSKMTAAIGLAAAAASGFTFRQIIRKSTEFDSALRGLQAVSGVTTDQLKALEEQARKLGATSMFSATQTVDAQRFLAQAGFEYNEIMAATPGVLQLATAANMDLASAADIASNVLGGMRLEVDDLNRVVDVLAATASGSNTDIGQLGEALEYAAPIAASAGVGLEEVAAAIGTLSDSGIQASRAGTGVVGFIRQLSNMTPDAQKALAKYELTVADVSIEQKGLISVLETLQEKNLETSDTFKIFGSEAGAAAKVLASGSDRVREFTGELAQAEGKARDMALVISSGLEGSFASFSSMMSETMLKLGRDDGVASGFQSVIDTGTGVLAVYNDLLPEFAENNKLSESQIDNLELLAGGLQSVGTMAALAIGGKLVGAVGTATGSFVAGQVQAARYQATLATMAGVSRTTALAQTALATSARAASTAMAFLGGPLGIAAIAAGSMYVFREELFETRREATDFAKEIDGARESLDLLTRSGLESAKATRTIELAEMREEAMRLTDALEVAEAAERESNIQYQGRPGAASYKASNLRREFQALSGDILVAEGHLALIDTRLDALKKNQDGVGGSTGSLTDKVAEFASGAKRLVDELDPLGAQFEAVGQKQSLLIEAASRGLISNEYRDKLITNLVEGLAGAGDEYEQWIKRLKDGIDPMRKAEQEIENIWAAFEVGKLGDIDRSQVQAYVNSLREAAEDGGETFEDQMLRSSERVASGLQDAIISGDWQGISTTIGGVLAGGVADLVGSQLTQTLSSSFSSIGMMAGPLGALGGAVAGGLVGSLFGGSDDEPYTGHEDRADRVEALLGGIQDRSASIADHTLRTADAVNELVGLNRGLLNAQQAVVSSGESLGFQTAQQLAGLFFSGRDIKIGEYEFQDQIFDILRDPKVANDIGVALSGTLKDASAQAFLDFEGVIYKEQNGAIEQTLGNALDSITSLVREAGSELGVARESIDAALSGVTLDDFGNLGMAGMGASEQADLINATLAEILDRAALAAVPDLAQFIDRIGEDAGTVLQDLVANNQVVTESLRGLNGSLSGLTGLDLARATDNLVTMAGGLSELQGLSSSFLEAFVPEQEREAMRVERLRREFESLGQELPANTSELRNYIGTLDLATQSGVDALLALSRAQDDLVAYFTTIESTADAALGDLKASLGARRDLISEALRDEQAVIREQMEARLKANQIALGAAREGMQAINREIQGIESAAERLAGSFSPIQQARRLDAMQLLRDALATGDLTGTGEAAGIAGTVDASNYGTRLEFERAQGQSLALLQALEEEGGDQLSVAEQSVAALEKQTDLIRRQGQNALDQAQQAYEEEIAALDQILSGTEEQINALRGIETGVLSVADAIAQMAASLGQEIIAGGSAGSPMASVEQLYQALLGREIGQEGRDYWSSMLKNGATLADVEWAIRQSDEFKDRLPGFAGGGISEGPASGYPVELHGREAVVPIPNGYIPARVSDGGATAQLVQEVKQLRSELMTVQEAIALDTSRIAANSDRAETRGVKIREEDLV